MNKIEQSSRKLSTLTSLEQTIQDFDQGMLAGGS